MYSGTWKQVRQGIVDVFKFWKDSLHWRCYILS